MRRSNYSLFENEHIFGQYNRPSESTIKTVINIGEIYIRSRRSQENMNFLRASAVEELTVSISTFTTS